MKKHLKPIFLIATAIVVVALFAFKNIPQTTAGSFALVSVEERYIKITYGDKKHETIKLSNALNKNYDEDDEKVVDLFNKLAADGYHLVSSNQRTGNTDMIYMFYKN